MADGRGVRLFNDLNNIFRRDPNIDEYDVLPVMEPKHNKSPLVLIEHKLGIELWCVPILYQYAYDKLFSWRSKERAEKFLELSEIGNLCRAVLLVNPECYTVWNIRKECVEFGDISIETDLQLAKLVLTKHPKSPETFTHRRWLLQRYLNQNLMSSNDSNHSNSSVECSDHTIGIDGISVNFLPTNQNSCSDKSILPKGVQLNSEILQTLQCEIDVCTYAAEHYSCNYNAWSHRIWLVQTGYNLSVQILLSELQKTQTWFKHHVSDHSGFHYRQFLLTSLINQSQTLSQKFHVDVHDLLNQEYDKTVDLIGSFPGHEALFYHRKSIFYQLCQLKLQRNQLRNDLSKENGIHLKRSRIESEKSYLIESELDSVTKELSTCSDKRQQELAEKYVLWLQQMQTHIGHSP